MKKLWCAVALLAVVVRAEAAIIIGNSVTGPYQNGTNFGTKAVGFLTGADALLLEGIQVAIGGHDSAGGSLTFTLNADAGGSPGSLIATIGTSPAVGSFAATAAFTIAPVSPLALAANTTYWIQVAFPATEAPPAWDRTDPAITPSSGLAAFSGFQVNSGSGFSPSSTFNAIIVEGSIAAVPEPASYVLLLAGLGLLGWGTRLHSVSVKLWSLSAPSPRTPI